MSHVETFHQPPGGRGALGCATLFLGIPGGAAIWSAYQEGGPEIGAVAAAGVALVFGAIYVFFNEDSTVTLDERGLRLTHRHSLLGLKGKVKQAWEIPAHQLVEATEITFHSPAKSGGWQKSVKLHLPGSVVLEPSVLGGEHDASTPYRKLVVTLEQRLGTGFRRENDFGPLGRKPAGEAPPSAPR